MLNKNFEIILKNEEYIKHPKHIHKNTGFPRDPCGALCVYMCQGCPLWEPRYGPVHPVGPLNPTWGRPQAGPKWSGPKLDPNAPGHMGRAMGPKDPEQLEVLKCFIFDSERLF